MTDHIEPATAAGEPDPHRGDPRDVVTRGFLFADLRGYTSFVETRGAVAAAQLLYRYRALVREAVAAYRGAEIKTEGDSFYVVFGSVSRAVECALAIQDAAAAASRDEPEAPLSVGVGVHAGETVETDEGYVGTAVNMAARLCSAAEPGEVLVSETVRGLVASTIPVRFESAGRRRLKGIAQPVAVYRAIPNDGAFSVRRRGVTGMALAIGAAAVIVLAAGAVGAAALLGSGSGAGGVGDSASGLPSAPAAANSDAVTTIALPSRNADPEGPGVPVEPFALEPGVTYTFEKLSPRVTFQVPPGNWSAYRDYIDAAGIQLLGEGVTEFPPPIDAYIGWVDFGRVQVVFDGGCLDGDTVLLDTSPNAFVDWLQNHEFLETSTASPINLGGYSGLSVDVTPRVPEGTDPCETDGPAPRTFLFPIGEDLYGLFPDERARIVTLDVDGRPFSIFLSATGSLDDFREQAQPLLDSLRIDP